MGPARLSEQTLHRAGLALLALSVVAGVVYSCFIPAGARFVDEADYLALGRHLAEGAGYSLNGVQPTAMRPPGYPFFLAPILAAGGGIAVIRIAQNLLVAGTVMLAARLTAKGPGALAATAGLTLLYPVLFYTAGTLYAQTLAGFLFVAALAQWLAAGRRLFPAFTGGLTFGALILTVPTFGLTFFVALAAAWWLKQLGGRGILAAAVGATLMLGVWTTRNLVQFHRFVPVASNSGFNFLLGNNGHAVPYRGINDVDVAPYVREADARGLDDFARDRFFREQALRWIGHHPGREARLYAEKTLNFFNLWNEYAPSSRAQITAGMQAVMAGSYLLLLGLLAWRLAETRRFPLEPREKFLLLIYVASAFTSAIFLTRIRFRLPYDYLLIAVIAGHLARRWLAPKAGKNPTER